MNNRINLYKNRKREDAMKISDVVKSIVMGFIITCIVLTMVRVSVVNGHSMDTTLYDTERLIVSRVSYLTKNPQRGDIVVASTDKLEVDYIIKRVIGVPGDKVELKNNQFYINGEKLDESYIKEPMKNNENNTWELGEDEYFLCGDNRNNSLDCRVLGPLKKSDIFGKIVFNLSQFKTM